MYFAILTLQNALFLKIITKKFAYVKKKQYLCTRFIKQLNINNQKLFIMKRIKKLFKVNVYNNILMHGFGWYQLGVIVHANNIKECIEIINKQYPFESSLQIYNLTDNKLYAVSETRKSYARY